MESRNVLKFAAIALCLAFSLSLKAQIPTRVYVSQEKNNGKTIYHELKIGSDYFVYSIYESAPPVFIKTMGGHYTSQNDTLFINLEFNSNYENEALKELKVPYTLKDGKLKAKFSEELIFSEEPDQKQELDGQWLFATRGPDTGQERRGEENSRKTLKFLMDGHFQWIAYNSETMEFFGTGGGSYTSKDGTYTENILYFSRDDSRVGASLSFNYDLKNNDWHHTGKNSKGEPLYEIWGRR